MPPMKIPDWEGKYFFIYAVSGMLITVDDPIRLMEDELPLSLIEKRNGKKEVVLQEEDWNGLEIKTISELFVANQVFMLEVASHNESEECKTPFTKRKEEDADLPDKTSTSKKLCRASIKVEKEKEE
ncbi:hypothetical protein Bca52824_042303 [Brassica carinata]|uniref:Uncharacterized protein n=1 Tax=Brassica carinata TaxID=52824 RepID=A0A8X7UYN0_BRACI|nr:hypothetical protein Bca52824_042303 [Brassica carinata]